MRDDAGHIQDHVTRVAALGHRSIDGRAQLEVHRIGHVPASTSQGPSSVAPSRFFTRRFGR